MSTQTTIEPIVTVGHRAVPGRAGVRGLHRRDRQVVAARDALDRGRERRQGRERGDRASRRRAHVRGAGGRQGGAVGDGRRVGAAPPARDLVAREPGGAGADRDRGAVHGRRRRHPRRGRASRLGAARDGARTGGARGATAPTRAGAWCSLATPRRPGRPGSAQYAGGRERAHPRGGRRGGSARHRRMRRLPGRAVRPHRGADPRAAGRRPLRRHALHDGPARAVVPSRRRCFGAPARSSPRPEATRGPSRRSRRDRPRGRMPRYTRRDEYAVLREQLPSSGRGSPAGLPARGRRCSSMRTITSTARPPPAPGSPSTARTRWRSPAATGRGSCSACSSPTPSSSRRAPRPRSRRGTRADRAARASTPARPARSSPTACSTPACCLSYHTQSRMDELPSPAELGRPRLRLRHLPGRVPVEHRAPTAGPRGSSRTPSTTRSRRSTSGSRPTRTSSRDRYRRLYVPDRDGRRLARNARAALRTSAARPQG